MQCIFLLLFPSVLLSTVHNHSHKSTVHNHSHKGIDTTLYTLCKLFQRHWHLALSTIVDTIHIINPGLLTGFCIIIYWENTQQTPSFTVNIIHLNSTTQLQSVYPLYQIITQFLHQWHYSICTTQHNSAIYWEITSILPTDLQYYETTLQRKSSWPKSNYTSLAIPFSKQ